MTAFTNNGDTDDGIDGFTNSHDRNGIFGMNDDTTARNAANPGGNGIFGFTQVPDGAGVFGAHNTGGVGVAGLGHIGVIAGNNADDSGLGVLGVGNVGDGVQGSTMNPHRNGVFGRNDATTPRSAADPGGNGVFGFTQVPDGAGVFGAHNTGGIGVAGLASGEAAVGVKGFAHDGDGVQGATQSVAHDGVSGRSDPPDPVNNPGQPAEPGTGNGVFGFSTVKGSAGVFGANDYNNSQPENDGTLHGRGVQGNGPEAGVGGYSPFGTGVLGQSDQGGGVQGFTGSAGQNAIFGRNTSTSAAPAGRVPVGNGMFGFTDVPNASGVVGAIGPNNTTGAGVTGIGNTSGALAGQFFGNVTVTGDIFLPGADCAEHFEVVRTESIEPGTVVVMNDEGALVPCRHTYDKKVAGVVSGAGDLRPGIILNKKAGESSRIPLALIGKVNCRVDADSAPIQVGDLLTTSTVAGHAMKVEDPQRAFGAVIGKALRPLLAGQGLIPILIALQ
jgi:hypothetical protein